LIDAGGDALAQSTKHGNLPLNNNNSIDNVTTTLYMPIADSQNGQYFVHQATEDRLSPVSDCSIETDDRHTMFEHYVHDDRQNEEDMSDEDIQQVGNVNDLDSMKSGDHYAAPFFQKQDSIDSTRHPVIAAYETRIQEPTQDFGLSPYNEQTHHIISPRPEISTQHEPKAEAAFVDPVRNHSNHTFEIRPEASMPPVLIGLSSPEASYSPAPDKQKLMNFHLEQKSPCGDHSNGNKALRKNRSSKCHHIKGAGTLDAAWKKKFRELEDFKSKHGHCNVPQKYEKNTSLGGWVARQRLIMRKWEVDGSVKPRWTDERMKKLKSIGLSSSIGTGHFGKTNGHLLYSRHAKEWEKQFASLLHYRDTYGNCDVPTQSAKYRSLGRWVSAQRKKHRQFCSEVGKDQQDQPSTRGSKELHVRFQRLNDIGFNFIIGSGSRKKKVI